MFIEKYYIINHLFMFMEGHYDRNGKQCSKVTQRDKTFLVDKSPIEILEDSIKCIGFDLRGAMATAKWIIGDTYMCPVMVNPIHRICVFPTKSVKNEDTIWINPDHIVRSSCFYSKTNVEFTNGCTLLVSLKHSAFNHKWKTADQLKKITVEIGNNPLCFVLEPQKRRMLLSR